MGKMGIKINTGFNFEETNKQLQILLEELQKTNKTKIDIGLNIANLSEVSSKMKTEMEIIKEFGSKYGIRIGEDLKKGLLNGLNDTTKLTNIINQLQSKIVKAKTNASDGKILIDDKQALVVVNDLIGKLQNVKQLKTDISKNIVNTATVTPPNSIIRKENIPSSSKSSLAMSLNNDFSNVNELRNSVRELYSEMGKVSVATTGIDTINSFTVKIEKANRTVDKLKYKLNDDTNQYELVSKSNVDSQVKELEKLEKQLIKVENKFHSLKYEPNTKQKDINNLKGNIGNLKSSEIPVNDNDISNIVQQIEKLNKSYENISIKDKAEGQRRISFYDTYIEKQKELNKLKLKELDKNVTDNTKVEMQGRVSQLQNELSALKSNKNNYYKKEVSVDNDYKELMKQQDYQMKIKQATYDDNQLLEQQKILYNELTQLQKEEFSIKNKLIGMTDEDSNALRRNLDIVKERQRATGKDIKTTGSQNEEKTNVVLEERLNLLRQLEVEQEKYNVKQKNTQAQNNIDKSNFKAKMQNNIMGLNTKYKELVPQEDITKINSMIDSLFAKTFKNTKELKNEMSKITNEFDRVTKETQTKGIELGQHDTQGLLSTLKTSLAKVATFMGAGTIIMKSINQVKQMVNTIIELDTEMVNLKKVTDETNNSYTTFLSTAHNVALELGKSSAEVIKATTAWAKTGETLDNATELSRTTLLGSNVGDVDVDTMQKFLIAPIKAWKMEAQEAIKVVDVLNNVSNRHAITVQDLGEAYSKSASIMAMTNNSLAETTALITSAQARTQLGGDVIGTGLKSISSRTYKAVDDEDGEAILNLKSDLSEIGVELQKTNGSFVSLYKVIEQLASVWDTLNQTQQSGILEKMAGTRQKNILSSMIDNFKEAKSTLNDALNSDGSAMNEEAKYAESIQFRINQMKEQMVGLYQKGMSSDFLKGILNFGSGAISVLDKMIEKLKLIGVALGVVFASNSKIKNSIFGVGEYNKESKEMDYKGGILGLQQLTVKNDKYKESLKGNIKFLREMRTSAQANKGVATDTVTGATMGIGQINRGLATTTLKLKAVEIGAFAVKAAISMGIGLAISFAVNQIMKLVNRLDILKDKNKEVMDNFNSNTKSNREMINYLQNEGKELDTLTSKTKLTTDEQARLLDIKQHIGDSMPELIKGYNSETGQIELQTKSTKELIELLKEKQKIEDTKLLDNGDNKLEEVQKRLNPYDGTQNTIAQYEGEASYHKTGQNSLIKGVTTDDNIDDLTKKLAKLQEKKKQGKDVDEDIIKTQTKLTEATNNYNKVLKALASKRDEEKTIIKELNPYMKAIINGYEDLDNVTKQLAMSSITLTPEDILKIDKKDFSSLTKKMQGQIDSISKNENAVKIQSLIEIEEPDDSQIKDYFNAIYVLAEQLKMPPLDLVKMFPLKMDKESLINIAEDYVIELEAQLRKATNDVDKKAIKGQIDIYRSYVMDIKINGIEDIDNAKNNVKLLEEALKKLQDEFSKDISSIEFFKKALKELDENGGLSSSTIKEIAMNYSDLVPYLNDTAILHDKLSESIKNTTTQANTSYSNMLLADTKFSNKIYENTKWLTMMKNKYYGNDLKNNQTLAQGKAEIEQKTIRNIANMWSKYYDDKGKLDEASFMQQEIFANGGNGYYMSSSKLARLESARRMQREIQEEFKRISNDFSYVIPSFNPLDVDKNSSSSSKSNKSNSKVTSDGQWKSIYDAMLEDLNKDLSRQQAKIDKLNSSIGNLKTLDKRTEAIKEQNKLIDEEIRKRNQIQDAQRKTQAIENEIASNAKNKLGINLQSMSERQITDYYNDKFGWWQDFGNSDNPQSEKNKKAYDERKAMTETILADYKKVHEERLKYDAEYVSQVAHVYEVIKQKYEDMQALREESFKKLISNEDNLQELNKQNELLNESNKYLDNKLNIQKNLLSNEQLNKNLLVSQRNEIIAQQRQLSTTSLEWILLNEQVKDYTERIEDSNTKLSEMQKNVLQTLMDKNYKITADLVFNGTDEKSIQEQINKDKKILSEKKKALDESLKGNSKDYSLDLIQNDIYKLNNKELIKTFELMKKADVLNKDDYETLKKKLNIKQLEYKLQNLQFEKTVQSIAKMTDGNYDLKYEVDKDEIDKVQSDLTQAKIALEEWNNNIDIKYQEGLIQAREEALQSQKDYLNQLKVIQDNMLNGQYATQEEFVNAILELNKKLGTEFSGDWIGEFKKQYANSNVLKESFDNINGTYTNFITQVKDSTKELSTEMTLQINMIANSIKNMTEQLKNGMMEVGKLDVKDSNPSKSIEGWLGEGNRGIQGNLGNIGENSNVTTNKLITDFLSNIKINSGFNDMVKSIFNKPNDEPKVTENHYHIDKLELPNITSGNDVELLFEGISNLANQVLTRS